MKITVNNIAGKFLLALRAGKMESDQIYARFSHHPPICRLVALGYVAPEGDGYVITPAGLKACPSRRDTGAPRGLAMAQDHIAGVGKVINNPHHPLNRRTSMNTNIPEGYRQRADGALVPESTIKPIDLARDELVNEIVEQAKLLSGVITKFKGDAFADIQAFVEMSAEQYGAKLGGNKGNVSLLSFDGRYKIQRAIAESISFGEQLQAAKALIDECIHAWSEGANANIRVLVNDAFQVDKEGNISIGRVLGLRRLNITDTKWQLAMQAISDAIQVVGSKSYIRVYERVGDSDRWQPVVLDVAGA